MNAKLRCFAVLFASILVLASCIPVMGQVIKGSMSAQVADPSGAVVAGAQVKAKNIETGVVLTTTTDNSGLFRLNLIPVGTYSVQIVAQGFKTANLGGVIVEAGRDAGLGAIKMTIGEKSTIVEVTAETPLITPTESQITSSWSNTALNTFAGIQENEGLDRLALFVPGVTATRSDNFSNTNGVGFSSNGLRGRNNDQEIDGQNNNDNSVGGPGLFLSNTDFVSQYVIVTNNFGPEYGRNAGSVVNIITKSGTNAWHGSVFGVENNSFLNALSNTQHNTNKPGTTSPFTGPPRSNNEFSGGSIGGPVIKNKMFIFGGFDNQIISASNVFTSTSLSPTPAGLAKLGSCGVDPRAFTILQKYGPYAFGGNPTPRNTSFTTIGTCVAANSSDPNGVQVGGVTRVVPTPAHGFDFITRADLQSGSNNFMGRYIFNRNNSFNSSDNGAAGWFFNVPALSQAALLSWTRNLNAHMVNEARVGFSRLGVEFGGGFNQFEPVAGQLVQALTNISFQAGGALSIGPATNLPQSRLVNTWQGQDNWSYVRGKHSFKAGANFSYQRSPNIFLPIINGQYRFTSLNSFLTTYTPNRVQVANGNPSLDFREYDTFLYAGDDWKIGSNLTLNLGVTWTYYGTPSNLFNNLTTPRESNPATAFWLQSLPLDVRTTPKISGVMNSIGPSAGFAYSPQWGGFLTGHGKTVIRGGYRLLYDPPYYNIFVNMSSSSPMTFLQTITTGLNANMLPLVPTGPNVRTALAASLLPNTFDPRTQNETQITPNFGPDKVHTWSLGIEREISKNSVIEARYVGNHGTNLFQTVDGNPYVGTAANPGQLQAGLLPAGTPSCGASTQSGPGAGSDLGRLNCGFGVVRTRNNGGFSDYQGVQVEFRASNLFKQLFIRSGYTFSKNLDNVSEIFATGTAGNTLFAAQNPFQTGGAEKSISGLDIPQVWSVQFTEQLPFFKEQHGWMGHVLGGWAVSADYLLASGQGYTPVQSGESANSPFGNVYDSGFVNAFVGDSARLFYGSKNAPANTIGVFAADGCTLAGFFGGLTLAATKTALCGLPATTLVSLNALNNNTLTTITNNDVRFIINSRTAQQVFGTPFGNSPRNPQRDAISNIANLSVFKTLKLGEHAKFEMHATLNNAFNHFNFTSIVPNVEFAGRGLFGGDFANPSVTTANGRTMFIGGKVTF